MQERYQRALYALAFRFAATRRRLENARNPSSRLFVVMVLIEEAEKLCPHSASVTALIPACAHGR